MPVQLKWTRILIAVVAFVIIVAIFTTNDSTKSTASRLFEATPAKPKINLTKPPGKPFERDPLLEFEGPPAGKRHFKG